MIPYVRQIEPDYGRCHQVSPLIQRVIAANPGPFTFTGTGTYIIGQSTPDAVVAVIDPGPLDDAHLQALLTALEGRKVSHILITHRHRDHAPLARPLAERVGNPPILAMPALRRPNHVEAAMEEEEDTDFQPDHLLTDGQMIEGQGWTLETVFTPGHTSDHASFALIEENALFSGDHVMGWSTSVVAPPDGDMAAYMASLDRVMARGFDTLWPTHGPAITAVEPFLRAYCQHRLDRENQIISYLVSGPTSIAEMVPVLYAAVDQRLWPAASLSILAHLIKLVGEGRVACEGKADLIATYRLT